MSWRRRWSIAVSLRMAALVPNASVSPSFQEVGLPRKIIQFQTLSALGNGGSVQTRFRAPRLAS